MRIDYKFVIIIKIIENCIIGKTIPGAAGSVQLSNKRSDNFESPFDKH